MGVPVMPLAIYIDGVRFGHRHRPRSLDISHPRRHTPLCVCLEEVRDVPLWLPGLVFALGCFCLATLVFR